MIGINKMRSSLLDTLRQVTYLSPPTHTVALGINKMRSSLLDTLRQPRCVT